MINKLKQLKLAIIGLGYVGLPLALEFQKKRSVIGFDIEKKRIQELRSGIDRNIETSSSESLAGCQRHWVRVELGLHSYS